MKLVVMGSFGIDTVETPNGEKREDIMGGSCAYFAAAASFYTRTCVVGVAGEDYPAPFKETLNKFDIDLAGLEIREGKTFRWGGKYKENMDERDTLFTELNVLGGDHAAIPESYKDAEVLFLANAPPAAQRALLKEFPKRKLVVADTMNLWIDTAKEDLLALLKEIDGLVLNNEEALQLTGERNPVKAAKEILTFGPSFVVIKKGEHGALFLHEEGVGAIPAFPSESVIDPTGAGDTFAGGMMGYLAARKEPLTFEALRESLAHGTVMASFTIEDFSLDRLEKLSKEELGERYKEFVQMLTLPS
jgi:sugar/nucleoside kinase (ribokinase family)